MKAISLISFASLSLVGMLGINVASAHVSVKPEEVAVATRQNFTVGVPNEKEMPTVSVRLVVPDGIESVTPLVKPGWVITTKKEGEGEGAKVTEITWTGGKIPNGQKDEFTFSAQAPAKEGEVAWKAYQTYEDGTIVSWDKQAEGRGTNDSEDENSGPSSETAIVNDLGTTKDMPSDTIAWIALAVSIVSLLAAGLSSKSNRK